MSAPMSRRRFLQLTAIGAGAVSVPITMNALEGSRHGATKRSSIASGHDGRGPRRSGDNLLVMIEMSGGHDGFSTVVPTADRDYNRLRSVTRVDKTIAISDGHGWHPALAKLARRGAAGVLGVGVANPNLSHFEMSQRWWAGAPDGATPTNLGFLGRLCDEIGHRDAPAVGVTIGGLVSPALLSASASTLSLSGEDLRAVPVPGDSEVAARVWLDTQRAFGIQHGGDQMLNVTRSGIARASAFGDEVAKLSLGEVKYPGGTLADQLKVAAALASANLGIRIMHLPWGSFDTHSGHNESHATQLGELDAALDVFRSDIARRGVDHRVVIATTSEFGRRASDGATNGLDHGTASNLVVVGSPVRSGLYGAPVNFGRLNDDGNVRATTTMVDYYATFADWLGVAPDRVLPGRPRIIARLLHTV